MPIIDQQLEILKEHFPGTTLSQLPNGAQLVTIPNVRLPQGWSQQTTTIYFIAPVGYPLAKPDCFWADPALRLSNGGMPQAANITPIPDTNQNQVWFSWHAEHWNPNRDSLLTYMRIIEARLKRAQ